MLDLVYHIDYEVFALLLSVLLYIETRVHYPRRTRQNRIFRIMTLMVIITEAFDLAFAFSLTYSAQLPTWVNVWINSGYFMAGLFLCYMLEYYITIAFIPGEKPNTLLQINQYILIAMELCYIPNAVGGYFFSISPEGAYIHGPLYLAQHLVSLWFVLCASVTLIANHKRIKRDHVISGYLFIALYLVAIVLQTFVWPDVLIIMPVVSVMLLIAVFSLESPDYIQLQKTLQALSKTQQELETANEKLRNLAYIDLMTGLQNRTAYHLQIERLGATAGTEDVVVLMADINGLKALNDHLGHLVGDDAIKRTARLIRDAFDGRCSCYRIGGDEFAVIASDVTEAEFQERYARFLKAVSQDSERVSYSFSVASGYQRMGQKTLLDTQREADERMYADKERQKRAAQAYDGLPFVSGRRS